MFFIRESRFRKLKYSGHDKIGFKAQKKRKIRIRDGRNSLKRIKKDLFSVSKQYV